MKILFTAFVFLLASSYAKIASANAIIWGPNGQALSLASELYFPNGSSLSGAETSGPASSLDNELPTFDSTSGKLFKQSGVTLRNDGSNVFLVTPDSPARGFFINSSNGVAANGSGSQLEIRSGDATQDSGTGLPGTLVIGTGLTSDAGSRGNIFLDGFLQMNYKATATAGIDLSGTQTIAGVTEGTALAFTTADSSAQTTGGMTFTTGDAAGDDSGDILFESGAAPGGTSGDVTFQMGAGATQGSINFLGAQIINLKSASSATPGAFILTTANSIDSNNEFNQLESNPFNFYDADNSDRVSIAPPSVVTSYDLTLPAAQGAANTFLKNDGSGALTWSNAASNACTYKVATTTGTTITATCTGSNYPVSGGCSTAGAGVLASGAPDPAPTDGQAADVPTGWACTYTVSGSIMAYALCCSP